MGGVQRVTPAANGSRRGPSALRAHLLGGVSASQKLPHPHLPWRGHNHNDGWCLTGGQDRRTWRNQPRPKSALSPANVAHGPRRHTWTPPCGTCTCSATPRMQHHPLVAGPRLLPPAPWPCFHRLELVTLSPSRPCSPLPPHAHPFRSCTPAPATGASTSSQHHLCTPQHPTCGTPMLTSGLSWSFQ